MPLAESFADRLLPILQELAETYPTPFYVYDAHGIVDTYRGMAAGFGDASFRQHFAVKALPNPAVLELLVGEGSGLDCSSVVELRLAELAGAAGPEIVFTSSNTTAAEYGCARATGALVTFDDRAIFDRVDELPDVVAFRVAPQADGDRSPLMGGAAGSKFGVPEVEVVEAYREAKRRGSRRFGIHRMTCANELDVDRAIAAAVGLIELAAHVAAAAGIELEYVNVGGGLGIPYRPAEPPFAFRRYAEAIVAARKRCFGRADVRILMECGRYVTGPHGVLVTRVVNRCAKGRQFVGVDASMASLMRPALYDAYHHMSLPFAEHGRRWERFDVVGSLCENTDRLARDRWLPGPEAGDLLVIHDAGAHAHAMGFTYNGRLRPGELLLRESGDIVEIRRPEAFEDYTATLRLEPMLVHEPGGASVR